MSRLSRLCSSRFVLRRPHRVGLAGALVLLSVTGCGQAVEGRASDDPARLISDTGSAAPAPTSSPTSSPTAASTASIAASSTAVSTASGTPSSKPTAFVLAPAAALAPPLISLGAGLLNFTSPASQWVSAHPVDPRTPEIARRIASKPSALWLTGDSSFGNLTEASAQAALTNRTMVLTMYNIPMRYDGLSAPSTLTLAGYKTWVNQVAATIGKSRAIVILEPDALWFYDRMYTDQDRAVRLKALNYAIDKLVRTNPTTRVYIDAGTSSGSVTPGRMAALLTMAGISKAAGYAVNTSSYAPTASIQPYAQGIRHALQARGISNPRYVVDTGRNGASKWSTNWCNPSRQKLGLAPSLVRSTNGLDLNLWIKGPATSDGDCGPAGGGAGTYGGEFMPSVAVKMIS